MTSTVEQIVERAYNRAVYLMAEGYSQQEAVDRVCAEAVAEISRRPGLGEDLVSSVQKEVQRASQAVSPWLWILSVVSFAMAVMNRAEIAKMFGSWKKMKHDLLG